MSLFAYCTSDEAKYQLNIPITDTTHDHHIQQLIYAASAAVKRYVGDRSVYQPRYDEEDEPAVVDSNYEPQNESWGDEADKSTRVRPEVKQAVLVLISEMFVNREGAGNFDGNYLPSPVRALVYHLRDPVGL
jgi:hypothetical protein